MPDRTPQEQGREFERRFAACHGAELVPNSGAGPKAKLDVDQGELLWSLKHTTAESYRLTAADVQEMERGARGPGSRAVVPAMAIDIAGAGGDVSVIRTSDLLALARGELAVSVRHDRLALKLAAADAH